MIIKKGDHCKHKEDLCQHFSENSYCFKWVLEVILYIYELQD